MGRAGHRAVSLPSGEVLLVGGGAGLNTAELYDPTAGTFRSRSLAREGHTATLLTNGKVLFSTSSLPGNGVLYDPVARVFTGTGPMVKVRAHHTATLLPDGRVLFAGGSNIDVVELYDPNQGTFGALATMTPRSGNTATLLPDGRVLLAGGGVGAELFDVATASFSSSDSTATGGSGQTATLLLDGRVLLVGGWSANATVGSAQLYNPATGALAPTGSLATGRTGYTATLLPDGRVLVLGGWSGEIAKSTGLYVGEALVTAEIYDASARSFSAAGSLLTARLYHSATLLPDGKVLIAGGSTYLPSPVGGVGLQPLASTELYDPTTGSFSPGPSMAMPRVSPTATLLPDGDVLVVGGNAAGYHGHDTVALAEVYR